jgi:hypothetical protein
VGIPLRFFRENLKLGVGGEEGRDNEISIALTPVVFGSGIRLFEGVNAGRVALEPIRTEPTQRVTHLTYAVRPRTALAEHTDISRQTRCARNDS